MVAHDPSYLRTWAPFVHGFFIQGIDTWWTDAAEENLQLMLGSTVSGLTDRTCKGGLVVPDLEEAIDPQTAWLETSQPTFTLIDHDESLAQLFGQEPADADRDLLFGQILPTTDPLTTIKVMGDLAFDPTNKHIGIERIGPSKQRSHFPPFNFSLPPLYHPVDRLADADRIAPKTWVSSAPILWEGKWVALYRFFVEERNADVTRFGTFATAELVWWGVLRDRAFIGPNREWRIPCYGPDGPMKRPLNATIQTYAKEENREGRGDHPWFGITTAVNLAADESKIAVMFSAQDSDDRSITTYKSSAFHPDNNLADGIPLAISKAVDAVVQSVADGTNTGINFVTAGTAFENETFNSGTDAEGTNAAFFTLEKAGIRTGRYNDGVTTKVAYMHVSLHEKVWLSMGWDVRGQNSGGWEPSDRYEVRFYRLGENSDYLEVFERSPDGQIADLERYWVAEFSTRTGPGNRPDNGGLWRYYEPWWPQGASLLDMKGGQAALLLWDAPFWDGEVVGTPPDATVTINGSNLDRTRYFAVRGQYLAPLKTGDLGVPKPGQDASPTEVVQVCRASWYDDDGHVGTNSDGRPELYIEEWMDPRTFGFNFPPIAQDAAFWVAPAPGHEFAPLGTLAYAHDRGIERRYDALIRLLVSTGTGSLAFSGDPASPLTLTPGVHDVGAAPLGGWGNDTATAPMGLGIPTELLADPADIRAAYERADPDGSWTSPLQSIRLAWLGPVNSEEVIDTLTVPVGLGWRLHGSKYGLFPYFAQPSQEDVDLVIGETDLASTEGPSHGRKIDGQFSTLRLSYRLDPLTGAAAVERRDAAFDAGSRFRPGNLERAVKDLGLLPTQWWGGEPLPNRLNHWGGQWRALWSRIAPSFFAERNFIVSDLQIAREKGIDVRVGTLLRLTNPWPQNPKQGNYGLANALARVVRVRRTPEAHAICDVLVYGSSLGTSLGTYYAPCVRINGYNAASRLLSYIPNWRGTDETIDDTKGLLQPSWASGSGLMHVTLYRWNRREWSTGPTGKVESVDTVNNTITIESPGLTGTYYRDSDYLMIPSDYDNVNQADWVKSIYGVITLADGTFGSGPTQGKRYV